CEPVDLATIAEDVLAAADHRGRRLHASLQSAVTSGDPVLLERLAANLVDNALRYNAPGGDLWLTTSTADGQATLAVANTGPVIAREALDRLFQPFQRLRDRIGGDGVGPGLAVVASITAPPPRTPPRQPRPRRPPT